MEKIKKIFRNKWVKRIGLPIGLIFLWFSLTLYTINQLDSAFSVLSYPSKATFQTPINQKLTAGKKVTGEFTAIENNLGIVSVRFHTFQRVAYEDEDVVIFRLKEKGQKNWYYSNTYKSGLFFNVPFYPFGFPIIAHSQNKVYVFELESTAGTDYNAVSISERAPIVATKYQENKHALMSNKKALAIFIWKKFINSFQFYDIQFFSFVYLLPFLFFTVLPTRLQTPVIKYLDRIRLKIYKHFDLFLGFLILVDIFVMQMQNDLIYLVIMGLWITTLVKYKIKSYKSLLFSFLFLLLSMAVYYMKSDALAEQAGTWGYMFLVVCVGQSILELREQKKIRKS